MRMGRFSAATSPCQIITPCRRGPARPASRFTELYTSEAAGFPAGCELPRPGPAIQRNIDELGRSERPAPPHPGGHPRGRSPPGFSAIPGVRVVAICDADRAVLDREKKKFADRQDTVDAYVDMRELLDDQSIDAVITATPNHWHALVTVWACQAGKDVYVEKPVSHDLWEGRQMVRAARKYNRIVQSGMQRRSDTGL
ncbi:MAG: Gfo/Idh/MocA family oxidoreductase, partial [bacterium]